MGAALCGGEDSGVGKGGRDVVHWTTPILRAFKNYLMTSATLSIPPHAEIQEKDLAESLLARHICNAWECNQN